MNVKEANGITEGTIWKQLLLFCIPIIIGTLFQQLYNTADVIIVGNFVGKEAIASVGGSSSAIINLVLGFFVGISSGVTIFIAKSFGSKNTHKLYQGIQTSILLSIVVGIAFTILGLIFTPNILVLMGTPKDIIMGSSQYLRIYFSGIIFVFIYNIGSAILRAMGDSKTPLYYLILCSLLNVILNIIFVAVFNLGVVGVGIATVIAQAISAILTIYSLFKLDKSYALNLKEIRFYKDVLKLIIIVGIPASFQSVMNSISGMIMQSSVNMLGTNAVAGNTAYAKMDSIFWMISTAFSVAIATFVGQNYGAKKYQRIKKSIFVCLGLNVLISGALSILFLSCGRYLFYLFTNDSMVIKEGLEVVKAIAPYYIIVAFYEILTSSLRGIGDVYIPMIINIFGLCIIRILWVIFVYPYFSGIYYIIISCPISWLITAIMMILYFFKKYKIFEEMEEGLHK